jgi:sugar lactone lactonase YvrE
MTNKPVFPVFVCAKRGTGPFEAKQMLQSIVAIVLGFSTSALSGQTTTVAFSGAQSTIATGFSAEVGLPTGIALDKAGDIFIADTGNGRVVELPAGGGALITVQSGLTSPTGVAVDGSGNLYVADPSLTYVLEIQAGGAGPVRIGANYLQSPTGVAVDAAGDVFVAGNRTVSEIQAGSNNPISVGSGYSTPTGVAIDSAGDIFIADPGAGSVFELSAGGSQTTLGSELIQPVAVSLDARGTVFIADTGIPGIVVLPAGGGAQTELPVSGLLSALGVGVDAKGDVYVADTASPDSQIVELQTSSVNFGKTNVGSSIVLTLDYSSSASVTIAGASVVTQGASGLDFTANGRTNCVGPQLPATCTVSVSFAPIAPGVRMGAVQLFDASNNLLATTPIYGIGVSPQVAFNSAALIPFNVTGGVLVNGVAVDASGDLFVALYPDSVLEIKPGGAQSIVASGLASPQSIAVNGAGNVFIANGDGTVVEVPAGGGAPTLAASGLGQPIGLAVDGAGNLFISFNGVSEMAYGSTMPFTLPFSGLTQNRNVVVDGLGNVFTSDFRNGQVLELPAGSNHQSTVASGLVQPQGVAVDAAGDVFASESLGSNVLEVPPGCIDSTCQVILATFPSPEVAVDASGNLFMAGTLILEAQRSQASPLAFGATAIGSTSTEQIVTLQNIGNSPLTFSGLSLGTSNFALDSGTTNCSTATPLSAGAFCNVGVVCTPTATGLLSDSLTVTDNALNLSAVPELVPLTCTGIQTQEITFTTTAPASAMYGANFTVAASGGASGNPVVFSAAGACTNSGSSYTMTSGTGTCSVIASQTGSSNYAAAQVTLSTAAVLATDTVTFTVNAPATAAYDSSFTVAATGGGSLNPVIYESLGECYNVGATYFMTDGVGTCQVKVFQYGDGNYADGTATQVTSATLASQAITFTLSAPASASYGSTFTVSATGGGSGNPVIFTSAGACKNIANTFTMISGTGACSVIANQSGRTSLPFYHFSDAPTITEITTATLASQTVAFTTSAPATAVYGSSFTPAAKASSGLAVAFLSSGACSNSGATYTMTSGTSTCSVIATQPGNSNYAPNSVTQTTTATKASQTIAFTTNPPSTAVYGTNFTVLASASSGLAITYISSGACANSGATYTITNGTGTCSVVANQAGNGNYIASAQATKSTTAQKATPSVSINNIPSSAVVGGSFSPTYTATSNGAPSVTSSTSTTCTVSGNTVSFKAGGTCTLVAHTAATSNYNAGAGVSQSLTIAKATLVSISPTSGLRGTSFPVMLTGTNLTGATAVVVSGTGVTASNITAMNGTTVTATFTVASNATISSRTVSVTTPIGTTNTVAFAVTGPTLTSINPTSATHGTTVAATLTGTNLTGANAVTVSGTGITVTGLVVTGSTTVTANFVVASNATLSTRTVSVTTPIGSTGTVTFTVQ